MPEPIISGQNIHYCYDDGTAALKDISLNIPGGSRVALLGPNGAGKTTLMLHLNGLLRPQQGSLFFRGQPYEYSRRYLQWLRQRVGLLFQNPDHQLFSATCYQDIAFGLLNLGMAQVEIKARIARVAGDLEIGPLLEKPPHHLSGGQKKLVALAGVLVMEPELIVCDEPTAGLDAENSVLIMSALGDLNARGHTVVLSTHDVNLAYEWAHEVIIVGQGRVSASGKAAELLGNPNLKQRHGLESPVMAAVWHLLQEQRIVSPESEQPLNIAQLADRLLTCTGPNPKSGP